MSIPVKQDFINHWGSFVLGLCCLWQSLILLFLRKRGSPFLSLSWAPSPPDQILPRKMSDRESYFWTFWKSVWWRYLLCWPVAKGWTGSRFLFWTSLWPKKESYPWSFDLRSFFRSASNSNLPLWHVFHFSELVLLLIYSYSWPKYTQCQNFELASTRL